MRLIPVTVALVLALTAAGCGADKPAAAPVTTPDPTPSATTDTQGRLACDLVSKAIDGQDNTLMIAGTVADIADAAHGSTDTAIGLAGEMLAERYDLAIAGVGTEDETSSSVNLLTAAIKLKTICIETRLDTE